MRTFLGCAVLAFGAAAGPAPADNVLELRVGETRHMTVYIADNCKGKPPAWVNVKRKLPKSKIVTFSDGDLGPRRSDRCGGEVVGREIDATGMKPGKETLKVQSGKLTVIVR
ncbi:hypothetical protein G5B31_15325 [Rhodobacter sp. SGA-6-6]|uniref:hypothetical protein n=1 Tax=Rhodobacter sp. SGA-6-6 TaxID=2710882 RepID=UPI0013ED78E4|nr:hypothetical protein [Rhodobacter sp. SGA-6-6]NGM46907.1 hypothetical protein [Rhodobacter sp. SGA-6-6]